MQRALFITHDTSNYGASRSLQLLLRNYSGVRIDLAVRNNLVTRNLSMPELRTKFGPYVSDIRVFHLPFDLCYSYKPARSLKGSVIAVLNKGLWKANKEQLYRHIEKGKYDFIHLNSLVLHPVITPDFPFVIHMRDIYDGSNPQAIANIEKARGVIFIDEATKAPFRQARLQHSIVLNNPFDMSALAEYEGKSLFPRDPDIRKRVVFSIIGGVSEKKGVDFIIRSFQKVRDENARLLIVGLGPREYYAYCQEVARPDGRIVFWGEEQDILKVYSLTDYVLRGEPYQCIGRTIYEGLYSGCAVVVPASADTRSVMFEYETFRDRIHSYTPRNQSELTSLLSRLSTSKVGPRTYRSNVRTYVSQFDDFVVKACASPAKELTTRHGHG